MDKALGMQNPVVDNVVLLVSRLLLAGIFVHEGVFLAANFSAASTAMAKVGVPTNFASRNELLHFEKDLAIAGGMFVLMLRGAGGYSVRAFASRKISYDDASGRILISFAPRRLPDALIARWPGSLDPWAEAVVSHRVLCKANGAGVRRLRTASRLCGLRPGNVHRGIAPRGA
jgi:putative oxidoreductase